MSHNKNKVFELKGQSLEAARDLRQRMYGELIPAFKALQSARQDNYLSLAKAVMLAAPILLGQKIVPIGTATKAFKQGDFKPLVDAFQEKYKGLYEATGQNARSVQVTHTDGGYPRAYAHAPTLYFYPTLAERILMIAPVDHKGHFFSPQDGILYTEEAADILLGGLFAGGHSDPQPVIHRVTPYGVQTPADFDLATSQYETRPAPFEPAKAQRLLWIFNNFMTHMTQTKDLKGFSEHDTSFKYELRAGANGSPLLLVEAFNNKTGAAIPVPDNACFHVRPNGHAFEVLPRASKPQHKADTAGGLALQNFLDEVPALSAETIWQKADELDLERFILPPPPPLALLHLNQKAPWPFPKSSP